MERKIFVLDKITTKIFINSYSIFSVMCLVMPTGLNIVKMIFIIVAILSISLKKKISISLYNIYFILSLIVMSLLFCINGIIHNAPGSIILLKIYIVYPCVYLLIYLLIKNNNIKINIDKIFSISLIIIIIDTLLFLLYAHKKIPIYLNFPENWYRINIYNGKLYEVSLKSFGSLTFLIPYYIIKKFIDKKINFFTICIVIISSLISIFSGRDILLIILFLTFLFLFVQYIQKIKIKQKIILVFFSLVNIFLFKDFILKKIILINNKFFEFERIEQFRLLFKFFKEKPILGYGMGNIIPNFFRSETQSWAFEYTYLKDLYDFGIIGFLYYMFILLLPAYLMYKMKQRRFYPILFGYLMLLLANASNPYFGKLDYLNVYLLIFIQLLYTSKNVDINNKEIKHPNYKI